MSDKEESANNNEELASSTPDSPQKTSSSNLPALLALVAFMLAAFSYFSGQQQASAQRAQIQSMAVRISSVEMQADALRHQVSSAETLARAEKDVIVHNELRAIASGLQRIEPLASGDNQEVIIRMKELLSNKKQAEE